MEHVIPITYEDLIVCAGLIKEAEHIKELKSRMQAIAEGTTSRPKDVAVQVSGTGDKVGDGVAAIDELERSWDKRIEASLGHVWCVEQVIQSLGDQYTDERDILRLRYIEGLLWEKVAEKKGFCSRQCQRYDERGLSLLGIERPARQRDDYD